MSVLWTAADAAAATGGRTPTDWQATGVSIDTRTLAPGDLFVALTDVRDGHDFVADALAKGAAAALVSRVPEGVAPDGPLLVVDDIQAALERLGAAGRARTKAKVVGITGSVGKTSTKEMLRAALDRQGKVHAAEASYNNHWGVPLTLARMAPDADFALIEIGMNRPGEIAPLARLARLDVAMITTVAAAHLEAFDDILGIAVEKAAIFEGLEPGGSCMFNGDLDQQPLMHIEGAAWATGEPVFRFGADDSCHYRLRTVKLTKDSTVIQADLNDTPVLFKLCVPGRHLALNAVAALAVVDILGLDLALAAQDLSGWTPPAGRGTREQLLLDPVDERLTLDLIDDAFNANPTSMAAALDVLAAAEPVHGIGRIQKGRRIAVLGDMLELGETEMDLHAGLSEVPALQGLDLIYCVGPRMRALHDTLPENQRGHWTETAQELAARAHTLIDAGDVLLIKGSKGSRVSLVVDAIRKLGHPLAAEFEGSD
ncbi:MAG: UDP-N-acetylmuramoyl-tripeptide--D-alanyl-D-alanine ligase [Rhodobacter sp.]|nr:UDP-N-acetylmuramoyl-tripeptide--D-alanyl-D-alanine ligase [Rhodobacter sp.]